MGIYSRRGDGGETGLFGGGRVSKSHARIEAAGAVDELNAVLGRALVSVGDPEVGKRLRVIQEDLFILGALLASTPGPDGKPRPRLPALPAERPSEMEAWIDEATAELDPLESFILPGGSAAAADLHVARTVCRRAERRVVTLADREPVDPDVIRYLNRLSDLLFTFGRLENRRAKEPEVRWRPPETPSG